MSPPINNAHLLPAKAELAASPGTSVLFLVRMTFG
jgi:hypothetical protein